MQEMIICEETVAVIGLTVERVRIDLKILSNTSEPSWIVNADPSEAIDIVLAFPFQSIRL